MARRHVLPWFRTILALAFVAGVFALVIYEQAAHRIFAEGEALRRDDRYQTAALIAYQLVIEKYPFSSAVSEARLQLDAIAPALPESPAEHRLALTWLEQSISPALDPYFVDQLPAVAWLVCTTFVMGAVFITRILNRPRAATLAVFLGLAAAGGTVILWAYYGLIGAGWTEEMLDAVKPLLVEQSAIHVATWSLMGLTALMMLTSTRKAAHAEAEQEEESKGEDLSGAQSKTPIVSAAEGHRMSMWEHPEEDADAGTQDAEREAEKAPTSPEAPEGRQMKPKPSGIWARIATYVLVAAGVGVLLTALVLYSRYDARASESYRTASRPEDHIAVVSGYPLTVASRTSRLHLQEELKPSELQTLQSGLHLEQRVPPILLTFDALGLILAAATFILGLAVWRTAERPYVRYPYAGTAILAAISFLVLASTPFLRPSLSTSVASTVLKAEDLAFHVLAIALGFVLLGTVVLAGIHRRKAVRQVKGRLRIAWDPLLSLYDRAIGSTWETRLLVWVTRAITHAAVFGAVIWTASKVWGLHQGAPQEAVSGAVADGPSAGMVSFRLASTMWADAEAAVMLLILAYGGVLLWRAIRAARASEAIEPTVYSYLLGLPLFAVLYRFASDLAASAQGVDVAVRPIPFYLMGAIGLGLGVFAYYRILVAVIDLRGTLERTRTAVRATAAWLSRRENRLRVIFHCVALLFLIVLMLGTSEKAPFYRLLPALNPTQTRLEGAGAMVSLVTQRIETTQADDPKWVAATPFSVVDRTKMGPATVVEIGVFWLAFAVGYVFELLVALVATVLTFAILVALVAPVMVLLAALVGITQTIAVLIDAFLMIALLLTGWNPGFASNVLWEHLGKLLDFLQGLAEKIRLEAVLGLVQSWGFSTGVRFTMALPTFLLMTVVLIIAYRWLARRMVGPDSSGSSGE